MQKRFLLTLCVLLSALLMKLSAQEAPPPIFVGADAPEWMHLIQADQPNVHTIMKAYQEYFAEHPFEKTSYTQYFKRWMQWARPYMQSDGSLHLPDVVEQEAFEQKVKNLRTATPDRSGSAGNWTYIGPHQTYAENGTKIVTWQTNIYTVDISASNPNIIYAGGEDGGAWRTTDKGLNWQLLTKEVVHGAISAIKVDPTNPDIAYFGTRGKLMKTTNGGSTWSTVYTETGLNCYEFAIHTTNTNIVMAATDKGLLRSTNGGTTWTKVYTNLTWTVRLKPDDPNTVWTIRDSGNSSNFMRSTDAGANFTATGTGWYSPSGTDQVTGAIIAVCPSNPSKLYAYLCGAGTNLNGYIGVFVSSNSGSTWANTHPTGAIGNSPTAYVVPGHTNLMTSNGTTGLEQGFYDMAIIVNPNNENQLIAGGTSWWKSNDGGVTWTGLGGYQSGLQWSHPDIQYLAASGNDLWIASDGGLDYSTNFGGSIQARMNGISGCNLWGFDSGWNEDVLVGGRYHNGNTAWHEIWPAGQFYRMGGAESPTGYVNPGDARKTYFSDIGGKRLKGGFTDGVSNFAVGLFPNESYAYYANSEMVWDPRYWNTVYLGNENKLWKSTDSGASFEVLYTFPGTADNEVFEIEIARSNPSVMYCSQWDGTDDKIWRSTDAGQTWVGVTALPLPNNNDRVKMAVSAENANVLWAAVSYGSNGKKIYKTTDGGQTWVNLTTSLLDGFAITAIMAQYGTNGGIYVGTTGGIFYRNNTMTNWVNFSDGLPYSQEPNRLKPFYKTGKIRNGSWGFGFWESNLYEPSQIVPQAMASTQLSSCTRDTVLFDDHSVVNHTGATWSWSFSPTPAWVSASNVRNPKVVFATPGVYTATMTLNGSYTSSVQVTVENRCEADTIPGKSVSFGGNNAESAVATPALNLQTNTLTATAWVKIDGIQPDYASIFMHDDASAGFNFLPGNNHLGYHWQNGAWWWDSGLTVPDNQWTHVAMVVEPSGITLYVNGKASKNTFTVPAMALNDIFRLGSYKDWGGRFMKGQLDEFCLFNTSLTQGQVRELMHLTKKPSDLSNLILYYQFNEPNGQVLDRVGLRHGSMVGSATRLNSTAPVGKGTSQRLTVNSTGVYDFTVPRLALDFPSNGTLPAGELCVTRIDQFPDQYPAGLLPSKAYWIVNNYGNNPVFAALDGFKIYDAPNFHQAAAPIGYQLYKRSSFAEGATWGMPIDNAEVVNANQGGTIEWTTGNQITSFSQFFVTYQGALPVEWLDFRAQLRDQTAVLAWDVMQAQGTDHYIVQKSMDGVTFRDLQRIGATPDLGRKAYTALDNQVQPGMQYYRIMQADRDGNTTYSPIRAVDWQNGRTEWTVYPNPVRAGAALMISSNDKEADYRFSLYDQTGRQVLVQRCVGDSEVRIPEQLAKGVYAFAIIGEQRRIGGHIEVK